VLGVQELESATGFAATDVAMDEADAAALTAAVGAPRIEIAPEYGVVMIKNALSVKEQRDAMKRLKLPTPKGATAAGFIVSHGASGEDGRIDYFHEMGQRLFTIAAEQVQASVAVEQMKTEPAFDHLLRHLNGEAQINVHHVNGMAYPIASTLNNHTDCPKSLFTMSVAIGHTCNFVLGKKTPRPHGKERNGPPITIQMESGDAMFFDAGCIPHAIDRIVPNTAPSHWMSDFARVSLLFREPDWLK